MNIILHVLKQKKTTYIKKDIIIYGELVELEERVEA